MSLNDVTWEEVGFIEIDAATAGFGDARVVAMVDGQREFFQQVQYFEPAAGVLDWQPKGVPMVAANAGADVGCPVERALDKDGRVWALRIEFVSDVADLTGAWEPAGWIEITTGRCVAADPFCMHTGGYWQEFGAPNGNHPVEVYHDADGDLLGIRVVFSKALERPQWGAD